MCKSLIQKELSSERENEGETTTGCGLVSEADTHYPRIGVLRLRLPKIGAGCAQHDTWLSQAKESFRASQILQVSTAEPRRSKYVLPTAKG